MKRYFLYLVAIVLALTGCHNETLEPEVVKKPQVLSSVKVDLSTQSPSFADEQTKSLITVDTEHLVNAFLFAFDASTKEIVLNETTGNPFSIYVEAGSFVWPLPVGQPLDIWVVANVGEDTDLYNYLSQLSEDDRITEDDLLGDNLVFTCSNSNALKALEQSGQNIPMSGVVNNITLSQNDVLSVPMKRLFAKYNLKLDYSELTAQGYTVSATYLVASKSNTSVPYFYFTNGELGGYCQTKASKLSKIDRNTEDDLVELDNGNEVTLYFLENCQGNKSGALKWSSVYRDLGATAVEKCSYIEVGVNVSRPSSAGVEAVDKTMVFRIYLGKTDMKSNFDVERNFFKTITLKIPASTPPPVDGFEFTNRNTVSVAPSETETFRFETSIEDGSDENLFFEVYQNGVNKTHLFQIDEPNFNQNYTYVYPNFDYEGSVQLTPLASCPLGTYTLKGGYTSCHSSVEFAVAEPLVLDAFLVEDVYSGQKGKIAFNKVPEGTESIELFEIEQLTTSQRYNVINNLDEQPRTGTVNLGNAPGWEKSYMEFLAIEKGSADIYLIAFDGDGNTLAECCLNVTVKEMQFMYEQDTEYLSPLGAKSQIRFWYADAQDNSKRIKWSSFCDADNDIVTDYLIPYMSFSSSQQYVTCSFNSRTDDYIYYDVWCKSLPASSSMYCVKGVSNTSQDAEFEATVAAEYFEEAYAYYYIGRPFHGKQKYDFGDILHDFQVRSHPSYTSSVGNTVATKLQSYLRIYDSDAVVHKFSPWGSGSSLSVAVNTEVLDFLQENPEYTLSSNSSRIQFQDFEQQGEISLAMKNGKLVYQGDSEEQPTINRGGRYDVRCRVKNIHSNTWSPYFVVGETKFFVLQGTHLTKWIEISNGRPYLKYNIGTDFSDWNTIPVKYYNPLTSQDVTLSYKYSDYIDRVDAFYGARVTSTDQATYANISVIDDNYYYLEYYDYGEGVPSIIGHPNESDVSDWGTRNSYVWSVEWVHDYPSNPTLSNCIYPFLCGLDYVPNKPKVNAVGGVNDNLSNPYSGSDYSTHNYLTAVSHCHVNGQCIFWFGPRVSSSYSEGPVAYDLLFAPEINFGYGFGYY